MDVVEVGFAALFCLCVGGFGVFLGIVMWRTGRPAFGVAVGTVLVLMAGGLFLTTAGKRLDPRTRTCTVTARLTTPADNTPRHSVRTRQCGELDVPKRIFDALQVGSTYRLRIQGGRWLSRPAVIQFEGEVQR